MHLDQHIELKPPCLAQIGKALELSIGERSGNQQNRISPVCASFHDLVLVHREILAQAWERNRR
jgi:hypothetical protein